MIQDQVEAEVEQQRLDDIAMGGTGVVRQQAPEELLPPLAKIVLSKNAPIPMGLAHLVTDIENKYR